MRRRDLLFREFNEWGFNVKKWRKETRKNYFLRARRVDEWLTENRGVSLVFANLKDLQHFMFKASPASPIAYNGYRNALRGFGDFLISRGIRDSNPALGLERVAQPRLLPKALDSSIIQAVEASVPMLGACITALVLLFIYTGLRHEELRVLEWSHVYPDRCLRFPGKGGHERAVPIHKKAWEALERWRIESSSSKWVFPSTRFPGRPISRSWLGDKIKEVGGLVGVHLHPHLFRHTVATQMLENGANERDVMEFLGHANLATIHVYTMVRPARLRDAVNRLDYSGTGRAEDE